MPARRNGLTCLSPATARATHTGREGGTYCTPDWHDLAFEGLPLAAKGRTADYTITPLEKLPPPVRRHALM